MANVFQNPDMIAQEALMHLEDSLVIGRMASKNKTSDFTGRNMKVGSTVDIETSSDFTVNDFALAGDTVAYQDIRETSRSFTIEHLYDVSVKLTAPQMALDLDSFSREVIRPAAYKLAEKAEIYLGTKILQAAGLYASDTLFETAADVALARKQAISQKINGNRWVLMDRTLEATLLGKDFFNQSQTRGAAGVDSLQSAELGDLMGMFMYASDQFPELQRTAGTGTTTTDNTVATDNIAGNTSLKVDATSGQFEAGDRIKIAGVSTPLIVASQVVATSTSIPLVDPITEVIPDGAAVTVLGSGQTYDVRGVIMDDRALWMAMPPLMPASNQISAVATSQGYSIRVTQGYNRDTKSEEMSLDLLIGAVAGDPRVMMLLGNY